MNASSTYLKTVKSNCLQPLLTLTRDIADILYSVVYMFCPFYPEDSTQRSPDLFYTIHLYDMPVYITTKLLCPINKDACQCYHDIQWMPSFLQSTDHTGVLLYHGRQKPPHYLLPDKEPFIQSVRMESLLSVTLPGSSLATSMEANNSLQLQWSTFSQLLC